MELEINNRTLLIGLVVVVAIFLLILLLNPGLRTTELCFNSPRGEPDARCVLVEIADNDRSRSIGLSSKNSLTDEEGMLFVFEREGRYGFWMWRMKFPIDIVWVDKEKRVVDISENLQPCPKRPCPSYTPLNDTLYVVEVTAGFAERYNITNESMVFFKLPE
ncbi:MAG: DUF192 domain-containing protein [Candidatus Altiarchaeota archaeon]|nr:DUF192 domain-containing protein [Candidatus Altiarchaeota archaeon]